MSFNSFALSQMQTVSNDVTVDGRFPPQTQNRLNMSKTNEMAGNIIEDVTSAGGRVLLNQEFEHTDNKISAELTENLEDYQQWEISTEIHLKRMEKSLKDARMTIEAQRNSLVELQLQNENLSQKLNESKTTQDMIIHKIEDLFEFYNFVESYSTKLDERIKTCEQSSDEMKYVQSMKCQEVESLITKFKALELKHKDAQIVFKNKLESEAKEKLEIQTEYQERNTLLLNQIREMELKLEDKDSEINNFLAKMQTLQDRNANLELEKENLNGTIEKSQTEINCQKDHLFENANQINELKIVIQESKEQLKQVTDDLNNVTIANHDLLDKLDEQQNSYSKKMDDVNDELGKTNELLTEKVSRIDLLLEEQQHLESEINDLKLQKDSVKMENAGLNKNLQELQDSNEVLSKKYDDTKAQLEGSEAKIQDLLTICDQLDQLKNDLTAKDVMLGQTNVAKDQLELEVDSLLQAKQVVESELTVCKSEMTEINQKLSNLTIEHSDLQTSFETEILKSQKLMDELKGAQTLNESLQMQLGSCQTKIKYQTSELEDLRVKNVQSNAQVNMLQEQIKDYDADVKKLKVKSEELENKSVFMNQDNLAKISKINKLENKLRTAVILQNRAKKMKRDLIEKSKSVDNLDNEIKDLNFKLCEESTEKKNLYKKMESLTDELQKLKNEMMQASNGSSNKISHLEMTLNEKEKKILEAESEIQIQKSSFEKLQQENQQLAKKYESHKAEFFSTLSSYKMSNQRIVSDKEKELASYRVQLEKAKEKHDIELRNTQRELLKLQTAFDKAKCQVEIEKSRKEEIEKQMFDLNQQISGMKNELKNKTKGSTGIPRVSNTPEVLVNKTPLIERATSTPKHSSVLKVSTPKSNDGYKISASKQHSTPVDKKKKVTFSECNSPSGSETSASDCLEISSIVPGQKVKGKLVSPCTISLRPPTPNAQQNSVASKTTLYSKQCGIYSEPKPVPRGQPLDLTPNAKKLKMDTKEPATPRKGSNKFFKVTQAERKPFWSEKKKKTEENLKWFDLDGVFGFNAED